MMWVLGLRRHVLAVAIGLLPLLAACGDSDDGHSRSTPTRTTVVAATATRTTASNPATPTTGPAHTSTPTSPPIPTNTPPTLPTVPSTATPTNPPAPTATATLPAPTSTATALEATSTATPVAPTSTATPTSTTEATPTPTEAGEPIDLTGAVPAAFAAHGSVEQVYVTDAEPGTLLELLTPGRRLLQSGTTDSEGVLLFRNVRAAAG